ncbi:hypothetical protein [Granulicella arctica]|uniref:Uncharacterized protein n=1 Tax=Granulicella arctica TaxID=940613 RepID=A0A7Y9TR15_9BACT|nr:hypothetical protein [Granulicella arctica]NYF77803.1 hypothetical protein [Granulicella arctica]
MTSVLCFFLTLVAQAQTGTTIESPVARQLEDLATSLRATQQQVEQSLQQIQRMQAEIDRLHAQLAAKETPSPTSPATMPQPIPTAAEVTEEVSEDLDVLKSAAAQQQQTKVESSSRLPVRLTGLVLFNAFVNRGTVDQIDLPSAALIPNTPLDPIPSGNTSTGASLRQTILGLEGTGPVLGGAQTSARVSMDFFGGITSSAASGPAGIVRLRTAAITAAWAHDTLEASYDTPLISPLSPESFATVALPSLAWSGNLWTWAPQFAWKHSVALRGKDRNLSFQLGLLDPQTLNVANIVTNVANGVGEASGWPSYETRLSFSSGRENHRFELGVGGLYGRQDYTGNQQVDTWATTADWRVPFGDRWHLSGELYRGRGLGDLGGGAYRNVVTYNFPNSAATYLRALDAEGGWLQWSHRFSSILNANASIGQDSASGNEIRSSVPLSSITTDPLFGYARNRTIVGNVIFRPWSSIIVSPEYRRLQSWLTSAGSNRANIYTLTFGYQF